MTVILSVLIFLGYLTLLALVLFPPNPLVRLYNYLFNTKKEKR